MKKIEIDLKVFGKTFQGIPVTTEDYTVLGLDGKQVTQAGLPIWLQQIDNAEKAEAEGKLTPRMMTLALQGVGRQLELELIHQPLVRRVGYSYPLAYSTKVPVSGVVVDHKQQRIWINPLLNPERFDVDGDRARVFRIKIRGQQHWVFVKDPLVEQVYVLRNCSDLLGRLEPEFRSLKREEILAMDMTKKVSEDETFTKCHTDPSVGLSTYGWMILGILERKRMSLKEWLMLKHLAEVMVAHPKDSKQRITGRMLDIELTGLKTSRETGFVVSERLYQTLLNEVVPPGTVAVPHPRHRWFLSRKRITREWLGAFMWILDYRIEDVIEELKEMNVELVYKDKPAPWTGASKLYDLVPEFSAEELALLREAGVEPDAPGTPRLLHRLIQCGAMNYKEIDTGPEGSSVILVWLCRPIFDKKGNPLPCQGCGGEGFVQEEDGSTSPCHCNGSGIETVPVGLLDVRREGDFGYGFLITSTYNGSEFRDSSGEVIKGVTGWKHPLEMLALLLAQFDNSISTRDSLTGKLVPTGKFWPAGDNPAKVFFSNSAQSKIKRSRLLKLIMKIAGSLGTMVPLTEDFDLFPIQKELFKQLATVYYGEKSKDLNKMREVFREAAKAVPMKRAAKPTHGCAKYRRSKNGNYWDDPKGLAGPREGKMTSQLSQATKAVEYSVLIVKGVDGQGYLTEHGVMLQKPDHTFLPRLFKTMEEVKDFYGDREDLPVKELMYFTWEPEVRIAWVSDHKKDCLKYGKLIDGHGFKMMFTSLGECPLANGKPIDLVVPISELAAKGLVQKWLENGFEEVTTMIGGKEITGILVRRTLMRSGAFSENDPGGRKNLKFFCGSSALGVLARILQYEGVRTVKKQRDGTIKVENKPWGGKKIPWDVNLEGAWVLQDIFRHLWAKCQEFGFLPSTSDTPIAMEDDID